jgi:alkaline phosphatase D
MGTPQDKRLSKKVSTSDEDDLCAHILISGLPFGTHFEFEILVNNKLVPSRHKLQFQTQTHWRHRSNPSDLTVAIGSCSYVNDATVDRPGTPYGGDPTIFQSIAKARPHAMLWLGDNVYFRAPDWSSTSGMRRRYRYDRRIPALQGLLGNVHHFAIWDDHDFGPNDSDGSFPNKAASLETFRLYWPKAHYGTESLPGVFARYSWGDVEFFCLDNRYHRSPNNAPSGADKVMFGEGQMDWLMDGLTSSKATFKIIVGGNQMLNPMTRYEAWGRFPVERQKMLNELKARKINGVLFLSGDRHHTELIRINREGTYPLFDYTSSPLLSSPNKNLKDELSNPARVKGTLVNRVRNFGLLRFRGKGKTRSVTLSAHGIDGEELWEHRILATSLR